MTTSASGAASEPVRGYQRLVFGARTGLAGGRRRGAVPRGSARQRRCGLHDRFGAPGIIAGLPGPAHPGADHRTLRGHCYDCADARRPCRRGPDCATNAVAMASRSEPSMRCLPNSASATNLSCCRPIGISVISRIGRRFDSGEPLDYKAPAAIGAACHRMQNPFGIGTEVGGNDVQMLWSSHQEPGQPLSGRIRGLSRSEKTLTIHSSRITWGDLCVTVIPAKAGIQER